MTPEIVAVYLAVIRIGAVVVSIADSFSSKEMQTRLDIAKCKLMFTQDVICRRDKKLPLYERTIDTDIDKIVVLPADAVVTISMREQDLTWEQFIANSKPTAIVHCPPNTNINIQFSSGTTGEPKAIPWNHLSAIKASIDAHLHQDVQPDDIFCWPTNLGWMMGPWLIFATFINKATLALTDTAPTSADFIDFVATNKVTILGLVPSIVKNWRDNGYLDAAPWQHIKCFSSSGECSSPEDIFYLIAKSNYKPMIEYCGGTEISGAYISSTMVQPNILSAFSTPALGSAFEILDEDTMQSSNKGEVYLIPPAMGLSQKLLNKDHHTIYYGIGYNKQNKPLRRHGDAIQQLDNNYYRLLGRSDDTMNLGGIKISAAEIERVVLENTTIKEAAAIAVSPKDGGPSELVVFIVLNEDETIHAIDTIKQNLQKNISLKLNPLFRIAKLMQIDALPRTSSNKIMRRSLRDKLLD